MLPPGWPLIGVIALVISPASMSLAASKSRAERLALPLSHASFNSANSVNFLDSVVSDIPTNAAA